MVKLLDAVTHPNTSLNNNVVSIKITMKPYIVQISTKLVLTTASSSHLCSAMESANNV